MLEPIYLTDDDGNKIEQTSGSGDYIIIGYIDSALFADTSGELRNTFLGIVEAASVEQKAEVLRGLRLAKSIRGRLNRFELGGASDNAYVKYNHSIFGGRFQSQYTALGAIAGTYLRRGGSAFTKELVQAALVTGPFANFSNFPSSPVLPGDVTFQVNAGGGTVSAYAWSITDGTTTFNPTGPSVTETLTEGTWTVSCVVTIDSSPVVVAGQTLEVSALVASSVTSSDPTPSVGDDVLFGLTVNNESLLGTVTWSVEMEVPLGASTVFIPVDEDIHYNTVSASGRTTTIEFLVGGNYRVTATYEDANGQNAASLSIASQDAAPAAVTSTTHSTNFSSELAGAYRAGDVHMIICGDSICTPNNDQRFRFGQATTWSPARWAGSCMHNGNGSNLIASTGYESNTDLTSVTGNKGAGLGVSREPYTNSSKLDDVIAIRRTNEASYMQFESDVASSDNTFGTPFFTSNEWLRDVSGTGGKTAYGYYTGRLQQDEDTFYRASGAETRVAVYGLNDFTLLAKGDTAPQQNVSITANNYSIITLDRDPSLHTEDSGAEAVVQLDFGAGTDIGDGFGLMDMMSYNSNIDGLSLSYVGNSVWNTANHSTFDQQSRVTLADNWYNDDAIENHLRMYGFRSAGVLRDNIVVCLWIQNRLTSEGHVGQMINDVDLWRGRWEAAADAVDASMKANMTFLVCTMPDVISTNESEELGSVLAEVAGQSGFENVALLDLNKKIKTEGINIAEYTGTLAGGSGTQSPLWYGSNTSTGDVTDTDPIHPVASGSQAMMSFWWDVVVNEIAASPSTVNGDITADPVLTQVGEAIEFDIDSLTGDTDRIIIWLDQNGTEVARGANPILSDLDPSVTRVDARIITADGADVTLVGPAIEINTPPSIDSQLAIDGGVQPVSGASYNLVITASDADGDNLTYTLSNGAVVGPLASGAEASFTLTAGAEGVDEVFSCTVSDGKASPVPSGSVTVTPSSANSPPTSGSTVSIVGSPTTEGDTATITLVLIDDDLTPISSLTYAVTFSTDGGSTFSAVSDTATATGNVLEAAGQGIVSSSHVFATAGSYIFRVTVTDGDGASADFDSAAVAIAAAPTETMVWSATANRGSTNPWTNLTVTSGSGYWETRTGSIGVNPFSGFVALTTQARWFTASDPTGSVIDTLVADSNAGTHEVRMIAPDGEVFTLSQTWVDAGFGQWNAASGTATGSVQGSLTGSAFLTNELVAASVGDTWTFEYWQL